MSPLRDREEEEFCGRPCVVPSVGKTIRLKHSSLKPTSWGCVTTFNDNTYANSTPHYDGHYFVISHRCGYGDDVMRYCFEHDYVHLFLAERLHDKPSPVLWGVAHNDEMSGADSVYEETLVQTFQAWMRAAREPILSGVNWHLLKQIAINELTVT